MDRLPGRASDTSSVMAGLVPAIQAAVRRKRLREMPGTSPGMTEEPVLSLPKGASVHSAGEKTRSLANLLST